MSSNSKVAVHFGAGNIGRGLVGSILQEAGYFVVFADINDDLVSALRSRGRYLLTELGDQGRQTVFDNFTALHSTHDRSELISALSSADVITASVGVETLGHIAPIIEAGLLARTSDNKAVVMACENAINASDILFSAIENKEKVSRRAVFCNTAVDRIVPLQNVEGVIDVSVEEFSEWVIDISKLDQPLDLDGTIQVRNLEPYLERKLFTVNTAHLAAAYFGQRGGHETIVSSLSDTEVAEQTRKVLRETSAVLKAKHSLAAEEQDNYVEDTFTRLTNPAIDDFVSRVGRQPIRKLSRHERVIGPAAYFAENLGEPSALIALVDAALSFRSAEDGQVQQLSQLLAQHSPAELVQRVCGIEPSHPLAEGLINVFDLHKSALSRKH